MFRDRVFDRGRRELLFFSAVSVVLVLFRSFLPIWYEGFEFDSDQAVVGLMAKHLAEGRAFPLFFYGQHYMLGVQSWMAAPFFLLGGPSVFMLRLPLVLVNCAVAVLLIVLLTKQARLRPAISFVVTLGFLMPPAAVASSLLETLGASVEPFLYVLLLWMLRRRPIWFGLVFAIGFLHREFTLFAIPALIAVMVLDRSLFAKQTLERAMTMVLPMVGVWTIVDFVKTRVDVYGPRTGPIENGPLSLQIQSVLNRVCVDPRELAAHARSMFIDCLPDLFGGRTFPLRYHGVNSTLSAGSSIIGWLLVGGAVLAVARIVVLVRRDRSSGAPYFAEYLGLVGLQSMMAYPFSCEIVPGFPGLIRYVLLGLLVPIALGAIYLKRETFRAARMAAIALFVLWAGVNFGAYVRVVHEYQTNPPVDKFRQLADYLVANQIRYARGDYWDAYAIDFLSNERVVMGSEGKIRVREYERLIDAHRPQAARIVRQPCSGGIQFESWCIYKP